MQSSNPTKITRRHFTTKALSETATASLGLEDVEQIIRREAHDHRAAIDWQTIRAPYAGCGSEAEINKRAGELLSNAIQVAKNGNNFLVDLFSDAQVELWDAFAARLLTTAAEQTYRQRVETAVLCFAAPCPVATAEKLLALHRAGRLKIVKGVRDVRLVDDGGAYAIAHAFGIESATLLVNTTGTVDRSVVSQRQRPLLRDLARQGLLSGYQRDGITMYGAAVDMATLRAEGARNIFLANMHLWGPGFFTSSAFMMATLVERLLAQLFTSSSTIE